MTFLELSRLDKIKLYAGDIYDREDYYNNFIGLSLSKEDDRHIKFNILEHFPIEDNSIDVFLAEDVLEHIPYDSLVGVFNEIYRILKPNGYFRIGVPDYNCDVLYKRSLYDYKGDIVFDPNGGGTIQEPGHLWFPTYQNLKAVIEKTDFFLHGEVNFMHYYVDKKKYIVKPIDYSKGYIMRTPDHDKRVKNPYRPMSIVVDLHKGK